MSVNQIIKTVKPLSNDELFNVAPSIFSESPIEGISDKYSFVLGKAVQGDFPDIKNG
jgi:hypothetical protein